MSSGGSVTAALDLVVGRAGARSGRGATSRLYRPLSGRTSAYCRSTSCSLGVVPVQPVAVAVALEQLAAWRPSRARPRSAHRVVLAAGRAPTPSGRARPRSARRRRRRSGPRRTCGPARGTPSAAATAVILRPSRSVTRCCSVGSWETACSACDRAGRRRGRRSRKPVLDHRQHQRGGADLEVGRDLGEVGVADDHVQPAVLLGVGVRLVAGVDDRALERRLQADLDLEVVGPLADLEAVRRGRPGRCRPGPAPVDDLAA